MTNQDSDESNEDNVLDQDFLSLRNYTNNNDDEDDGGDSNYERESSSSQHEGQSGATYNNGTDLPPWMKESVDYRRTNHLVALHNEIVGFCRLMEPREDEMRLRNEVLDRFTKLAKTVFPKSKVQVFGSQATGLCLPSSDIDIAIQLDPADRTGAPSTDPTTTNDDGDSKNGNKAEEKSDKERKAEEIEAMENWDAPTGTPLHRLAAALRKHWMPELYYLEVIEKTRVPLVKFKHGPTMIAVDVCFDQESGPQAARLMHQYMDALPPLRPLTFVLKYFMASRGLNQPYTGGVGSFLLQMMIVSFLQHRERSVMRNRQPLVYNLGGLLIEFFELYGIDFNYVTTGISVRFDGFYFPKGASDRKEHFWQPNRQSSFAVENPFDITSDVGASSFRMNMVQRSFEIAYKVLLSHVTEPFQPTTSILASILPVSEEMTQRVPKSLEPEVTSADKLSSALQAGRKNKKERNSGGKRPKKRQRRHS
ncbi:unnamed protein product [Cylindrotheca closterium]|uniref:Polynucleotide adenylyltransferase n=1 Tax=Cylindrotheca closterium TaxID=2856 RepID=A0AAD2JND3_9STRA|nr:unnamed protein product [Cylindrotheca closterium]